MACPRTPRLRGTFRIAGKRDAARVAQMFYYVYILENADGSRHYVGMALDPEKRLKKHNSGLVFSTKAYKPWTIIYTERLDSRISARAREKFLKSYSGVSEKRSIISAKSKFGKN